MITKSLRPMMLSHSHILGITSAGCRIEKTKNEDLMTPLVTHPAKLLSASLRGYKNEEGIHGKRAYKMWKVI